LNKALSAIQPSTSQRASVEAVDDDDVQDRHNAGSLKNANTILESVDNDDNNGIDVTQLKGKNAEGTERKDTDMEDEPEETDEDELSKLRLILLCDMLIDLPLAHLQKNWQLKIYAFFQSKVNIAYVDSRKCHEFICSTKNCKAKGNNPCIE
jgi:hypothetical protein